MAELMDPTERERQEASRIKNPLEPTKEEALKAIKAGVTLPRMAEFSRGYAEAYNVLELEGLTKRAAEAKAKGEALSINDQLALDRALEKGWIVREKELWELPAQELMKIGLEQAELDHQGEAVLVLNELTRLTQELEAAVKAPKWHDFPAKVQAARKAKELRASFEKAAKDAAVKLGEAHRSRVQGTRPRPHQRAPGQARGQIRGMTWKSSTRSAG